MSENQQAHIEYLQSELLMWLDTYPTRWKELRGYIPTFTYKVDRGEWSEGVEYVVLSDYDIAYRESGDWRDDSDWKIVSPLEFYDVVIEDACSWLVIEKEKWIDYNGLPMENEEIETG